MAYRAEEAATIELGQRVAAIRLRAPLMGTAELASDLQTVRRIAQASGMAPAITVLHAIDSALARGERGPLVDGWLSILGDAVDCGRHDASADSAFAAACSVRLSS